jgi:hypothetical protein
MKEIKNKLNLLALIMLVVISTTQLAIAQPPDIIWQSIVGATKYDYDHSTVEWLRSEGYSVFVDTTDTYFDKILSQQEIDELNAAKLIIISVNSNSGDYTTTEVGPGMAQVTTPVLCQNSQVLRSNRMKFFSTDIRGAFTREFLMTGFDPHLMQDDNVLIETNAIDSIVPGGNETLTLLADNTAGGGVIFAEFAAGVETYPGGYTPGGKWVYFGPKGQKTGEISLTDKGKELYLNLINYLINPTVLPIPANFTATVALSNVTLSWDAVAGAVGYNVYRGDALIGNSISDTTLTDQGLDNGTFDYTVKAIDGMGVESGAASLQAVVADDNLDAVDIIFQTDKYSADSTIIDWLRSQQLTVFVDTIDAYRDKVLSQQEIDELNAASLIIISRETNSADFRAEEVGLGLAQVTTPVLCQNAYAVRNSRMMLFNSAALVENAPGDSIFFQGIDPELLNVSGSVLVDTTSWTYILPEGTENYSLLADPLSDGGVLIAEFKAGVETYPGGYTPGGDWVFFAPKGTNSDAEITFTEEGLQLYKNLIKYMMGTKDIVWQVRPDKYNLDHNTIEWLRSENYAVFVDTTDTYFDKVLTQQEIDELNALDLIIISPNANSFDYVVGEVGIGMAQVTTPVLVQSAFVARSSKMRLINTETLADAIGSETYFTGIDDNLLSADSALIDINNIKYIVPAGTENYTLLADPLDDMGVLIAEFKAGVETYPGGYTPGGNWVFFAPKGSNDNEEVTFTEAGKELYLNLLTYMITPPEPEGLPAPENLIATVDLKDVTLVWDSVPAALAYNVYRDDVWVGDSISEVTFTDIGLEDAVYKYTVRAIDSKGVESPEEASVNVQVLTAPVAPALLFVNVTNNIVKLSWPPAIRAAAYNVYRGEEKIASAITSVSFTDEGLENGTYTYSVTSLNVFDVESAAVTKEATVEYDTTNVEELAETGISIYPNPFQSELFIDSKFEITSLRVLNINGQVVRHELNDNKLKIVDTEKGIYFIEINNAIIKKVFKN